MRQYQIVLVVERPLSVEDVNDLQSKRSGSITNYIVGPENTITTLLDAPSLIAAQDAAEIQVQRSTGLRVVGLHVLP